MTHDDLPPHLSREDPSPRSISGDPAADGPQGFFYCCQRVTIRPAEQKGSDLQRRQPDCHTAWESKPARSWSCDLSAGSVAYGVPGTPSGSPFRLRRDRSRGGSIRLARPGHPGPPYVVLQPGTFKNRPYGLPPEKDRAQTGRHGAGLATAYRSRNP